MLAEGEGMTLLMADAVTVKVRFLHVGLVLGVFWWFHGAGRACMVEEKLRASAPAVTMALDIIVGTVMDQ